MFAKVFEQIFDSSIAEDYEARHLFMDLLTLADQTGRVDMTPEAISRRTNVPFDVVCRCLEVLERPDPRSRSVIHEGRRIVLLEGHRDWGWQIVNYQHYREVSHRDALRAANRDRQADYRKRNKKPPQTPPEDSTEGEAEAEESRTVTHRNGQVTDSSNMPTEQEAVVMAANAGVPEDFVRRIWTERMASHGLDGAGRAITRGSWLYYVKKRWNQEQAVPRTQLTQGEFSPSTQAILDQRELDRVEASLKRIADGYDSHADMTDQDREKVRGLRKRQKELLQRLRMQV